MVSLQIFKGCKQSGGRITTAGAACWEFGEATCSGCTAEPFHSMAGPQVLPLYVGGRMAFGAVRLVWKGKLHWGHGWNMQSMSRDAELSPTGDGARFPAWSSRIQSHKPVRNE